MIGKTPTEHQMTIFETALESFIDMNHELVLLAQRIDWSEVEREFSKYYCKDNGRPSVPARKMVGLMYLKNLYNLSDEDVVERWMENPYMQYFTEEKVFQKRPPINPADFSKFRKRIGPEGAEILFRISLCVNADEITEKEMERVLIGSTVQEKNLTYPTDAKLLRKIVDKVLKIEDKEDIILRRTYTREMKALKLKVRFMNHPKRRKEGEKAVGRMRTIAGAMVRDLDRKLNGWQRFMYGDNINLWIRGTAGDAINTLMAAAAYNLRHWMNKLPKKKLSSFVSLLLNMRNKLENLIIGCGETYGLPYPVLATVEY